MRLPIRAAQAGALLLPLGLFSGGCELMIAGPRAQASDQWEKTYAVDPSATLEIENTNGAIDVRTHAEPTIIVKAQRTAKAVSEQGARDLLARTNLEQRASADFVQARHPPQSGLLARPTARGAVRGPGAGDDCGEPHDRQRQGGTRRRDRRRGTRDRERRHRGAGPDRTAEGGDGEWQHPPGARQPSRRRVRRSRPSTAACRCTCRQRPRPTCRSGPSTAASPSTASPTSPRPSASGATTRAS